MKLCVFYTAAVSLVVVFSVDCRSHGKSSLQVRAEQPSRTNSNNTDLISGHEFSLERQDPKINIKDDTSVEFYGEDRIQRCFYFYNDTLRTWNDAKALCEAKGMRLAECDGIDVVGLRLLLVNRYGLNQFTWIGARGNGNSQIWQQSGSVLSNSSPYWYPGMPQSSSLASTKCLELDTVKAYAKQAPKTPYFSVACTETFWTLCERVISDCNPSCQNGGSCNAAKECVCQPGWMGDSCDIACGRVNRKMKIVNGTNTEIHEYPWQVLVNGRGMCGGSLIHDRWVITAAHCTAAGTIMVTLGNHLLDESESAEIKVRAINFHDHPQYNRATMEYDFSLLELETSLNLASIGPHIAPVCLPKAANPSQYDDVEAITSGWGTTTYGGSISNILLEATVKTMTNSHCNEVYKYGGAIKDSMICAAAPGKDSCQGDSGGPLVTEVDGFYNLIGAVSWGRGGCAHSDYPGVYARITYVIDWITTTTSQSGRSVYQN